MAWSASRRRFARRRVARMASPKIIREIMAAVDIPVMAKCRIGHFAEAQILQELASITLTSPKFSPRRRSASRRQARVHGSIRLRRAQPGRALRRIAEGAAMIRTRVRLALET